MEFSCFLHSEKMDISNTFQTEFQLLEEIQNTERLFEEQREIARVPRVAFRDQENPLEALSDFDCKANLAFSKDGIKECSKPIIDSLVCIFGRLSIRGITY